MTIFQFQNETIYQIAVTDLRQNYHYVLWYQMIAGLLLRYIIPFVFLLYFNYIIFMKTRQLRSESGMSANAEDIRLASILFSVVILFMICHLMGIVLNVYEAIHIENIQEKLRMGCFAFPIWSHYVKTINTLMITINSAANPFIFAFVSPRFRRLVRQKVQFEN